MNRKLILAGRASKMFYRGTERDGGWSRASPNAPVLEPEYVCMRVCVCLCANDLYSSGTSE